MSRLSAQAGEAERGAGIIHCQRNGLEHQQHQQQLQEQPAATSTPNPTRPVPVPSAPISAPANSTVPHESAVNKETGDSQQHRRPHDKDERKSDPTGRQLSGLPAVTAGARAFNARNDAGARGRVDRGALASANCHGSARRLWQLAG
ncbi:unnamed protein product [Lampetra fluviatilis]